MLNKIKKLFSSKEILSGNFGIERETLRLDENGYLPKVITQKNLEIKHIIHTLQQIFQRVK